MSSPSIKVATIVELDQKAVQDAIIGAAKAHLEKTKQGIEPGGSSVKVLLGTRGEIARATVRFGSDITEINESNNTRS